MRVCCVTLDLDITVAGTCRLSLTPDAVWIAAPDALPSPLVHCVCSPGCASIATYTCSSGDGSASGAAIHTASGARLSLQVPATVRSKVTRYTRIGYSVTVISKSERRDCSTSSAGAVDQDMCLASLVILEVKMLIFVRLKLMVYVG